MQQALRQKGSTLQARAMQVTQELLQELPGLPCGQFAHGAAPRTLCDAAQLAALAAFAAARRIDLVGLVGDRWTGGLSQKVESGTDLCYT